MVLESTLKLSGSNLERVADHNQRITLHAIRVKGSLTKAELTKITGLTAPSIANIAKKLIAEGLIAEAGRQRGGRGQPPTNLVIRSDACYSIGVNIDRDHITIVIVDFLGTTIARARHEIAYALPNQVKQIFKKSARALIKESGIQESRLIGIGVAMPDELGHIELPGIPSEYKEWDTTNVSDLFSKTLSLPIFIENDATAAAMGELQLGLGQKYTSFFYILFSAGLGGGLIVNGEYFRGSDGRSGELGFFKFKNSEGEIEQIQNVVSISGLNTMLNEHGYSINDLHQNTAPSQELNSIVESWIEKSVRILAPALISVNLLINPSAILLGGYLPSHYLDQLSRKLEQYLLKHEEDAPAISPVIKATLSEEAPAVGAAILPFSHFLLPKPGPLWKTGAV